MSDTLFSDTADLPLSERLRPQTLDHILGQTDILSENSLLRNMIAEDNLSSFILWGPPGTGKTSIANVIAHNTKNVWKSFSAVISGIKEVKEIMEEASASRQLNGRKTVVFVDEIHRFNKAQQDAFLPYVENGSIILIGATTENPSFSVISPLLSRMRVFILHKLTDEEIRSLIERGISLLKEENNIEVIISDTDVQYIVTVACGDARRAVGILEMALKFKSDDGTIVLDKQLIEKITVGRLPNYDKKGDFHYDYISALHKSMRNSDPDAAVYYATKMLDSGEDPMYIMRRVIRFSTEDVGLADPNALQVSIAAKEAVMSIGMPEASLAILEAVIYNAVAPKSNALEVAYHKAQADVKKYPDLPVPLIIRNAPTKLMKESGYGDGYQYAHDLDIPVANMRCLPDQLADAHYYEPKGLGFEKKIKEIMSKIEAIKNQK